MKIGWILIFHAFHQNFREQSAHQIFQLFLASLNWRISRCVQDVSKIASFLKNRDFKNRIAKYTPFAIKKNNKNCFCIWINFYFTLIRNRSQSGLHFKIIFFCILKLTFILFKSYSHCTIITNINYFRGNCTFYSNKSHVRWRKLKKRFWEICFRKILFSELNLRTAIGVQDTLYNRPAIPSRRFGKFFRRHISQAALTLIRFHYVTLSPNTYGCLSDLSSDRCRARRHFSDFSPRFSSSSLPLRPSLAISLSRSLCKHGERRWKCVSSFLSTAEELYDRGEVSRKTIRTRFPWFRKKIAKSHKGLSRKDNVPSVCLKGP